MGIGVYERGEWGVAGRAVVLRTGGGWGSGREKEDTKLTKILAGVCFTPILRVFYL